MNICGIEKISLVDYDGLVATTLFCGGCDFACPFCHNGGLVKDSQQPIPIDEVLQYLNNRKKVLDAVVVSGGEPTLQPDLIDFLKRLRDFGLKIKLDTNGNNYDTLEFIVKNKLVDYVAMDVKNDLINYAKTINKPDFDTTNIQKSINLLKLNLVDYEFRTTIVKEFHAFESITNMSQLLANAKRHFLQKFKPSDNCLCQNLTEIDIDTAKQYAQILAKRVAEVKLRGYDD
ncbi:MAG: anaerobic ribonucleoside-triphosphate reductase activating protein [Clostridia bacterium]|nr:anaerobic ribonucleoside-triphosphate reductase activating protein [Clostridia bacterium]